MKKLNLIATVLLTLVSAAAFSQNVVRTPFLELGDKPLVETITIPENSGYSIHTVYTSSLDNKVKAVVKGQKDQGFKKVDKASLIFSVMNTLNTTYPVEAGYTYRIIAVTIAPQSTFILHALDAAGKDIDEGRIQGDKFRSRADIKTVQLKDFDISQNGTITLQNGTMSMDRHDVNPVRYLIFRKKSK